MNNEAFIPTEQISKRGIYTKTYSVGPGKYKAFSSSVPLHVLSGGKLLSCDARFQPDKESGENVLISHGSCLTVHCAPSSADTFINNSDSKACSLSWNLEDAIPRVPEISEQKIPLTV